MVIKTTGSVDLTFSGLTAKMIVYRMMKQDFLVCTKTDYMQEVKERIKVVYDFDIDFDDGDHRKFLDELARAELITIEG